MTTLAYEPLSAEGPSKNVDARVLRADFGDGYSQRAADGINPLEETWDCEWEHLDSSEVATLEAQFTAAYGVNTIDWTPPGDSTARKFTIKSWTKTPMIGEVYIAWRVNAILKREYDL